MFTEEEKKLLLSLVNSAQISGNRQQIGQVIEKLDAIARKIEALPTIPEDTAAGDGAEVDPTSTRSAVPPSAAGSAVGQHRRTRR